MATATFRTETAHARPLNINDLARQREPRQLPDLGYTDWQAQYRLDRLLTELGFTAPDAAGVALGRAGTRRSHIDEHLNMGMALHRHKTPQLSKDTYRQTAKREAREVLSYRRQTGIHILDVTPGGKRDGVYFKTQWHVGETQDALDDVTKETAFLMRDGTDEVRAIEQAAHIVATRLIAEGAARVERAKERERKSPKPARKSELPSLVKMILTTGYRLSDIADKRNLDTRTFDDIGYLDSAIDGLRAWRDERIALREGVNLDPLPETPKEREGVNLDPLPETPKERDGVETDHYLEKEKKGVKIDPIPEVWERGERQEPLRPIGESDEGIDREEENWAVVEPVQIPARQFAEVHSSPSRSNLQTSARSEHRPGWNADYNSQNLNDRLRALADERGLDKWGMMNCPLHTEKTPSVHVTYEGEQVKMYCFPCKKGGKAILDTIDGGFVPVATAQASASETSSGKRARITATYVYRAADNTPVYKVLRTDPKGFPTMRFDTSQGRYVRGMAGTDRILYRLPELLAADPAETVFVVEGEKSANLLAKHGLVVTCPGGATKWNPETMVEPFRDRRVIVLPDNDGAGDDVAFEITLSLWDVAARTSVLPLPGLGYKEDVFDWFAAGHTAEELTHLVNEI